jgi:hypothetical protein
MFNRHLATMDYSEAGLEMKNSSAAGAIADWRDFRDLTCPDYLDSFA